MVIVQLTGGLGNQLFQYAAAKALAIRNNAAVKLDISGFETDGLRNFELDRFSISASIASETEISRLKATTSFSRLIERWKPFPNRRFYKEPFFHFDPDFFRLRSPVYIKGYFQSEKYFKQIEPVLRREIILKNAFRPEVRQMAVKLKEHQSVAIHIRRGDYTKSAVNSYHGLLPLSYYREAIETIRSRVYEPKLYLFSDAPEMVKEALNLEEVQIISGTITNDHFEDLYLMSQCRHTIIANSSFSWWSAWLNDYEEKIVIAPTAWFNEGPRDTQDIIPERWLKI